MQPRPHHAEVQRLLGDLAAGFALAGTQLYDLDRVPGARFLALHDRLPADMTFVGIGQDAQALAPQRQRLRQAGLTRPHELRIAAADDAVTIRNASVVILNLAARTTVSAAPAPLLLHGIAQGMVPGGGLLVLDSATPARTRALRGMLFASGFRTCDAFLQWGDLYGLAAQT